MKIYNLCYFLVTSQDLDDIVNLDREFDKEFDKDNSFFRNFVWDKEDFIFYLKKKDFIFTVAKYTKIIAFCLSAILGYESDLYKIIVDTHFRGKGIGKILLAYHLNYLKYKQVKINYLEVFEKNSIAINLYEKFGYQVIGRRKGYYGKYDAIVMKKML